MQRIEVNVTTGERTVIDLSPEEVATLQTAALVNFPNVKSAFILQIDTDADALIRTVIGERASQYESAEKQSAAYKAAGYTGTVPPKVQAWATAKNQTATWAADSQIATAEAWRSAEDALYAKRLLLKETARVAVDAAGLDEIKANWATFLAALKISLGA